MYGFVFGRGMPNVKIWYDYMWLQVLLNNSWGGLLVYATMLTIMHMSMTIANHTIITIATAAPTTNTNHTTVSPG